MAFAPGQFITAQRLNRLQSKTYWATASGTTAAGGSSVDVAGASIPITTETDGATMAISWTASVYATGVMGSAASVRPFIGADGAGSFALAEWKTSAEKGTLANFWAATVTTAGLYTVKLVATTPANGTLSPYTTLMVTVHEVA
jgi:hypothetical protein